jgi:hypothetical protein
MKQVTSFNDWLSENWSTEDLRLKELNEAFDPKDEMRIKDILRKADGDTSKAASLARTMANKIEDANKALRRGDAAKDQGANALADIFYARAKELGAEVEVEAEEEVDDTPEPPTDKEEDSEKPKKEKKPRAPRPSKIQPGDFVRITGQMVKDKKVGLAAKGGWRWIEATSTGKRALEVTDPSKERRGASGRYNRGYLVRIDGTAKIDLDYILDHLDQAIFYVKAQKVGAQWIEGIPMFFNGLNYSRSDAKIRIQKKDAGPNGPELDIILANQDLINSGRTMDKFFLGDEDFAMNKDGESLDEFKPGVYSLAALNFNLTVKEGEPVVYCVPLISKYSEKDLSSKDAFFAPISKCKDLQDSYTPEQFKVIADYMSKQLGAEVKVPDEERIGPSSGYRIPWFIVEGGGGKGFISGYNASPFFTREKAEKHIEDLKERAKEEKFPFDVERLKVVPCSSYQEYSLSFQQMMEYANVAGIGVKMRKFIEEKRGAIAAKKFGF